MPFGRSLKYPTKRGLAGDAGDVAAASSRSYIFICTSDIRRVPLWHRSPRNLPMSRRFEIARSGTHGPFRL